MRFGDGPVSPLHLLVTEQASGSLADGERAF